MRTFENIYKNFRDDCPWRIPKSVFDTTDMIWCNVHDDEVGNRVCSFGDCAIFYWLEKVFVVGKDGIGRMLIKEMRT